MRTKTYWKPNNISNSIMQRSLPLNNSQNFTNLSQRTFQRRFKEATYFSVHIYIQKVRIEAAKRFLESQSLTVNEIMFETGYQDPKAFRIIFKKETGVSPSTYRDKYS